MSIADECLYTVKSLYLGSEPMGELLEGENGSDVIQIPLKRTILRTNANGKECFLSVTNDSLLVKFLNSSYNDLKLPIKLLAYCGALRQVNKNNLINSNLNNYREFETLDKASLFNYSNKDLEPPLFVTIFRSIENENTLYCHSFIINKDEEAMELVRLVMEIYYNLIKLSESDFESDENELNNTNDDLEHYLNMYDKMPNETNEENSNTDKTVVSAKDIIKEALNSTEYKIQAENGQLDKYTDVPLNEDDEPIIIKKENNEEVVYKQNVFIRWLQPPTPPPPAPIIIREVQEPEPEQLPPIIIYKQAPRPETPPPLIIREKPPSPIEVPQEPLIIERRVQIPEKHRKIIIEHLPPPPAKPRDIILEKWLPPREPAKRSVFIQRTKTTAYQKPIYEICDNSSSLNARKDIYEVLNCSEESPPQAAIRHKKNSHLNHKRSSSKEIYSDLSSPQIESCYSKNNNYNQYISHNNHQHHHQQKLAGYRIIRQIIPGPNTTKNDIEKALARSQQVSCTVYSNQRFYSPVFDRTAGCSYQNHYQNFQHNHVYSCQNNNNSLYCSSFNSRFGSGLRSNSGSASGCYSVMNYMPHSKTKQIVYQQSYIPQNKFNKYFRKEIYRSSSIDHF